MLAGCVILVGYLMIREGQVASSMKAENREALILYGLLFCAVSIIWLIIHGLIALIRISKNGK